MYLVAMLAVFASAKIVDNVIDYVEIEFPARTYRINNITFVFSDKVPSNCANSTASGCAYTWNKTVYMVNHSYIGWNGVLGLCNHELCHIHISESEEICNNFPNIFSECNELINIIKSEIR